MVLSMISTRRERTQESQPFLNEATTFNIRHNKTSLDTPVSRRAACQRHAGESGVHPVSREGWERDRKGNHQMGATRTRHGSRVQKVHYRQTKRAGFWRSNLTTRPAFSRDGLHSVLYTRLSGHF